MQIFLSTLFALLAFILVILLVLSIKRMQSVNVLYRLRRHSVTKSSAQKNQGESLFKRLYQFVKQSAKPFSAWEISKTLDFKLRQAGVPLYGAEFIIISIIVSILSAVFFYIIFPTVDSIILASITSILGMWFFVTILVRRRRNSFTEQLGDCLITVANALRAGYSFQQAIGVVAKEMEPPISKEFERVMNDVTMGVSLEEALEQMSKRVGSTDFNLVVTAVLIQREVGGNLAQILDTISYTITERVRMRREINALTSQGRLSSYVLVLLPIGVGIFCWIFNRKQMMFFIEEEIGNYAIVGAIIAEIIGFIIIKKIIDIKN